MTTIDVKYLDGHSVRYHPDDDYYQVCTNYIRFNDSVIGRGVIDTIVPFNNVEEVEIQKEENV